MRARPTVAAGLARPARLRKALYLPALTALRYNPATAALRQRLRARGKPPMLIVGVAMRHLIHLGFGVLKTRSRLCSAPSQGLAPQNGIFVAGLSAR